MPRSRNRGHVGTLGDLLHGRTLYLYCNAESCGHHRKMDLVALIATHGENRSKLGAGTLYYCRG
jgi:hypothetical protein